MKTKIYLYFAVITVVAILAACTFDARALKGNGNIITEEFQPEHFHSIDASGIFRVILTQGSQPGVEIETDENILPYVNVTVERNTLKLSMEKGQNYTPSKLNVYVTSTDIRQIVLSGACSVKSDYTLEAENLQIKVSGVGNVDLDVFVDALNTEVSGAGKISISGEAGTHAVQLSGASELRCQDLQTQNTHIQLSGAGSARVYATEFLDANVSGAGSIRYGGNPKKTSLHKSGVASINPI